jgi:nitrate/nitrite transporter NarK
LSACVGIGLVLGILYTWSVIRAGIPDAWGWSHADKALPYAVACLVFSLTMVPAGRLQDRLGPTVAVLVGGVTAGLGCLVAALGGSSLTVFVAGFGVLTGAGIGFAYAAITPAAIKWFAPEKTGLVTGLVVASFGISTVYMAPLAAYLLRVFSTTTADGVVQQGVSATMVVLGVATIAVVAALSLLVKNPAETVPSVSGVAGRAVVEVPASVMLRGAHFYVLWLMYFCGAAAGLMFFGVAQELGKRSLGEYAFMAVVTLAMGNTAGRILGGYASDRVGRHATLLAAFLAQAVVVLGLWAVAARGTGGWPVILVVTALLGMNYGANLALFPAVCKDHFGLKGFGLNYGWLFTAWGTAGLVMPWFNGVVRDRTGSTDLAYFTVVGMLLVAAVLTLVSGRMGRRVAG